MSTTRPFLVLAAVMGTASGGAAAERAVAPVSYRIRLEVVAEGMDGDECWFHPRAGAIPGATPTVGLRGPDHLGETQSLLEPALSCILA